MSISSEIKTIIKNEIINNELYNNKSPSEIAILLNRTVSYDPAQYSTIYTDKKNVLISNATTDQLTRFLAIMVEEGTITAAQLEDTQIEIKTTRNEQLGIPQVSQGDIESVINDIINDLKNRLSLSTLVTLG